MSLAKSPRQYMGVRAILPPDVQKADRDPTASDIAYVQATIWLNTATSTFFIYAGAGNWVTAAGGSSSTISSITPTGGDLTVHLGDNIGANYLAIENLAGSRKIILDSAGVITANQLQTKTDLTLKLSDGAGASSLYVVDDSDVQKFRVLSDGQVEVSNRIVSVVADLELAAAASSDVITTLGDTGGVNKLSVQNLSNVEVASVGSDGSISGSLYIYTSTYAMSGQTTLVAGTKTISNTAISAKDVVILERTDVNGSTAIGIPVVTKSAGVGFTITSVQAASPGSTETNDVSIFNYVIMRRA